MSAETQLGARYDFLRRWAGADSWDRVRLDDLADVVGGGTLSTDEPRYWSGGSIPWATPTDITKNSGKYISSTEACITQVGLQESSAQLLPPGAVLLTSRA